MAKKEWKPYSERQEKFGEWFIKTYGKCQVRVYELTGGRLMNKFLGVQCGILTTIGRKTGEPRKTPLLYLREGENVVLASSKGGMTKPPFWLLNIEANPHVFFQIGPERKEYVVRKATEEEEPGLWAKLDAIYEGFIEYRARVEGKRKIPLLILEPKK